MRQIKRPMLVVVSLLAFLIGAMCLGAYLRDRPAEPQAQALQMEDLRFDEVPEVAGRLETGEATLADVSALLHSQQGWRGADIQAVGASGRDARALFALWQRYPAEVLRSAGKIPPVSTAELAVSCRHNAKIVGILGGGNIQKGVRRYVDRFIRPGEVKVNRFGYRSLTPHNKALPPREVRPRGRAEKRGPRTTL